MMNSFIRVAPFVVLLAVIGVRVRQGKVSKEQLGWNAPRSWVHLAMWWLSFVALALGVELVLWRLGQLELGGFHHGGAEAAVRIVGMIALAPLAEELLFRGLFLGFLERRLGKPALAIVLQAAVFVAFHNFAYEGTVAAKVAIAQSFVDACLFALARRQTGSIVAPLLMHMTGNAIAVAEMLQ